MPSIVTPVAVSLPLDAMTIRPVPIRTLAIPALALSALGDAVGVTPPLTLLPFPGAIAPVVAGPCIPFPLTIVDARAVVSASLSLPTITLAVLAAPALIVSTRVLSALATLSAGFFASLFPLPSPLFSLAGVTGRGSSGDLAFDPIAGPGLGPA